MLETTAISEEEKKVALSRALESRTFSRSEQLRAFLRYVCEADMRGSVRELNEHVIGVEVLGRPADYSPAEDSSVRTRAYELRSKLEKLYSSELTGEPIQIVIPKGAYHPQFVRSAVSRPEQPVMVALANIPDAIPPEPQRIQSRQGSKWMTGRILLALVLGAAATFAVMTRFAHTPNVDPILAEAWRSMGKADSTVLLAVATPLHLVVGPETHEIFGSPTYPAPPEAYPLFRQHRALDPDFRLGLAFTDNALGFGTMNAVMIAANTVRLLGASYEILPERVATLSALRNRNAILFGAPVDSEAISRTLQSTPLTVEYDSSVKEFVIRDRTTGRAIIPKKERGDFMTVYGLVTVLNTRESDHGRLGMIIFSGITSAGTHGAAEYFASPGALHKLRDLFKSEGMNGFPPAYQVVVRCNFSNMLLLSSAYDSHKVLQK